MLAIPFNKSIVKSLMGLDGETEEIHYLLKRLHYYVRGIM